MFPKILTKLQSTRLLSTHRSFLPASDVYVRVRKVLDDHGSFPLNVKDDDHFIATVKMDRLAVKEIIQILSSEFCVNVPLSVAENMNSINSATTYFASHPKAR